MSQELRVLLDLPVVRVPTQRGERQLVVDLWLPVQAEPLPCVVYIHGGAWRGGTQYRPPFSPRLFDEGIAIAAITYRFAGEAPFPAMLHDCKTMVRWLRARAAEFGLDPRHFAAWGISAGGHLAPLLGLTAGQPEFEGNGPHREQDSSVCAVVNWCGPTDLPRTATDPVPGEGMRTLVDEVVGGPILERIELGRAASPVHHVHPGAPPHLHVHGRRDPIVPVWHAEALHARLRQVGVESELYINEEAGHGLGVSGEDAARTRAFFVRHLCGGA